MADDTPKSPPPPPPPTRTEPVAPPTRVIKETATPKK